MLSKADINTLFGAEGLTLSLMYSKACELLKKNEDLFIDFGSGAEQIDSVMYDPYSKRVTFFYYFGEDRRSVTLHESDKPTFRYNSVFGMYSLVGVTRKDVTKDKESFTVLNLDGFFEHCKATFGFGNTMPILYEGEVGEVCSIHRNPDTGELDLRFSNYPTFSHTSIILKPAGDWEFTRKYPGLGQASKDPWVVKQKAPLNNDSLGKNFLKEVDLELNKYGSQARVPIINGAIFRYKDEHGDMKTFCSTSETKLRVLKLGDEKQLHLEHVRKMKID